MPELFYTIYVNIRNCYAGSRYIIRFSNEAEQQFSMYHYLGRIQNANTFPYFLTKSHVMGYNADLKARFGCILIHLDDNHDTNIN